MVPPTPSWMSSVPANERADAENAFAERLSALFINPDNTDTSRRPKVTDLKEPRWVQRTPKGERERVRLRFWLRIAALYASREGTIIRLSEIVGLHPRALANYTAPNSGRSRIAARVCAKVETATGGVVKREVLCPEVFASA